MKTVVWAAMQTVDVLEEVDRILPGMITEDDLRIFPRKFRYRRGLKKAGKAYDRTTSVGAGIALVTIGVMMLIPGPVDLAFAATGAFVGAHFGGPGGAAMGALIGVAIYNAIAVAVIVVGIVMIAKGLIFD